MSSALAADLKFPLPPNEIRKWLRFAGKGGIGKALAIHDKEASRSEELMFLAGDTIVILLEVGNNADGSKIYFGSCEEVLGLIEGRDVNLLGRLKRPVFSKRQATDKRNADQPRSSDEHRYGLGIETDAGSKDGALKCAKLLDVKPDPVLQAIRLR